VDVEMLRISIATVTKTTQTRLFLQTSLIALNNLGFVMEYLIVTMGLTK